MKPSCMLGSVTDTTCREINLIIIQRIEQKGESGLAHLQLCQTQQQNKTAIYLEHTLSFLLLSHMY